MSQSLFCLTANYLHIWRIQDGRVICTSVPTYGDGAEAGNEAGYIVGMSTCYPKPGSVKIANGENLILESKYSNAQKHTGVMGLFYILVADRTLKHTTSLASLVHVSSYSTFKLCGLSLSQSLSLTHTHKFNQYKLLWLGYLWANGVW